MFTMRGIAMDALYLITEVHSPKSPFGIYCVYYSTIILPVNGRYVGEGLS